jgi:hypothetical protein
LLYNTNKKGTIYVNFRFPFVLLTQIVDFVPSPFILLEGKSKIASEQAAKTRIHSFT